MPLSNRWDSARCHRPRTPSFALRKPSRPLASTANQALSERLPFERLPTIHQSGWSRSQLKDDRGGYGAASASVRPSASA